MKIGFDARFLAVPGGIPRYCSSLLQALALQNQHDTFIVLIKNVPPDFPHHKNIQWHIADIPWYGADEQIKLGRIMNELPVDLWHIPHWNAPITLKKPLVMTIHDLLLFSHPTHAASTLAAPLYWTKRFVWKLLLKRAIKHATAIITPSEFTKTQVEKKYPSIAEKIFVTHLAPGKLPHPALQLPKTIQQPYFLHVGNCYPHKNHNTLFMAFASASNNFEHHLYLATNRDRFSEKMRDTILANNKLKERVHFMFNPSDEILASLYAHATALVFPSQEEGFGLPPLEAFSYGTPVIAARTASLPEILKDYAIWFDPTDTDNLASLLRNRATAQNEPENARIARGAWASYFTWENTAFSTRKIYESVLY